MNYYDDNQNTEYKDEFYVPKKDKDYKPIKEEKEKKEFRLNKKLLIIIGVILIIFIIGIVFLWLLKNNSKSNSEYLENVTINNISYSPNFSKDIYDYYLLTEEKELTFECEISNSIKTEGCNETIDISNYSNYIHEIVINEDYENIYRFYVKIKESDSEENIIINSIDGINNNWSNQNQTISINAESNNKIENYSIDNGDTWQSSSTFIIENNRLLQIVVEDEFGNQTPVRQEEISNIDKESPIGTIIKEKSSTNEITLKVVAKDEESGIESYSWSSGSNKDYIKVKDKGTYSVTIKDKAGNTTEKISIEIKDSDFKNKEQLSVVFYQNGSTSISNDYLVCTKNNGKCTVTLPNIIREEGTVLGFSKDKDATTPTYKAGEKIELTENLKLYAITRKDIKANFEKNGANEISKTTEKCTLYNDDKYCIIEVPTIIHNNGKISGWNTKESSSTILASSKNHIKLYDNTYFYAYVYKEVVISFNKNGSKISSNKETCRIQQGNTSCFITTPSITKNDSEIIGWSLNKNDSEADVLANEDYEVTKDTTLYAITKKTINITFEKNGSDSVSNSHQTCTCYNEEESCSITTPTIARNNANIIGWSKNSSSKEADLSVNQTIKVTKDETYYAITNKKVNITFKKNGATSISAQTATCSYYNDQNGCSITTPTINRASWEKLGWSTNENATTATVKENTKVTVYDSGVYYAITYRTVTVNINKNNADSLGNCQTITSNGCKSTCKIYNMKDSCEIKLPYIYSKGNEVIFFSTSSDPKSAAGYTPAMPLIVYNDVTINAIVDNRYRKSTYNIIKTKNYGYTAFETESNCPSNIYNSYYNFTDSVYKKVPYVFSAAKVTFTSDNTFKTTWGSGYAGMTYGPAIGYRNIDIKCSSTNTEYYYHTIVHELTHAWDSYYQAKMDYRLSDTNDFKNLFNKYKNATKRPLREYSYSNMAEFVADVYSWYYFLYVDTSYRPAVVNNNTYFPADMKSTMEKYIKIAKNGYK